MLWVTAIAAPPSSSRACRTSGSCGWSRWRVPRWQAYRDGTLRFVPERRGDDYTSWLEGIRDWCISRQLWWGHRIPVWYCDADGCGMTSVSRTDLTRLSRLRRAGTPGRRRARHLVLVLAGALLEPGVARRRPGTWRQYYPGHTLVSSPDILFFWVARMIMSGLHFMGEVPVHPDLSARRGARHAASEDVEVAGERNRSARGGGAVWR